MSKKARNLLLGAGAVVLLTGVLIILLLTMPESDPNASQTETSSLSVSLMNKPLDAVETVSVQNTRDTFTVRRIGENLWMADGLENTRPDNTMYSYLAEYSAVITASRLIEESPEDLKKYGLDVPQAHVDISYTDGDSISLSIGGKAPADGGYYVQVNDESTVYLIVGSRMNRFLGTRYDYVSTTVMPMSSTGTAEVTITGIEVRRDDLEKPIILEAASDEEASVSPYNASTLNMVSPLNALVNPSNLSSYLSSVYVNGLSATDIAAIVDGSDPATLAPYGLDTPQAEVLYTLEDGQTDRICVGDEILDADGNSTEKYYVYKEGIDVVYIFQKDSLPWLTMTPKDIMSTVILTPYIDYVDTITLELGDKTYTMVLSETGENLAVTINGSPVDADKFRTYFQLLISAPAEDIYLEPHDGAEVARLTYHYRDPQFDDDVLVFSELEERKLLVSFNGVNGFVIRSQYIDHLATESEKILNNQEVNLNW